MSKQFSASTHKVDHGSDPSLDNLLATTECYWITPSDTSAANRVLSLKGPSGGSTKLMLSNDGGAAGRPQIVILYSGTNLTYTGSTNDLVVGKKQFIAFVFNDAGAANEKAQIYIGDENTPAVEVTYFSRTDPTGTPTSESGNNLIIAQRGNNTLPYEGDIHSIGKWNRELSLDEIRKQQFKPKKTGGCVIISNYRDIGNFQKDLSGFNNHGIVTGAIPIKDRGFKKRDSFELLYFIPQVAGITGTSNTTNADDTQTASGTLDNQGTSATTNTNDAQAASGVLDNQGTSTTTNIDDSQASSGVLSNIGTSETTNNNDSQASSGTLSVIGVSNTINDDDVQSSSGVLDNQGVSATINADDTQSASGIVGVAGITGSSITTNDNDISAAVGTLTNFGESSTIAANDVQFALGTVGIASIIDIQLVLVDDKITLVLVDDKITLKQTTVPIILERVAND